jgi:hypothetical protein
MPILKKNRKKKENTAPVVLHISLFAKYSLFQKQFSHCKVSPSTDHNVLRTAINFVVDKSN